MALYHAMLHPSVFSDVNGEYIGFDGKIHTARGRVQYANYSGWDIYRSQVQLITILLPKVGSDIAESLVADAQQGGGLPIWPVANDESGVMAGDPSDGIIASVYAFGGHDFDTKAALAAMLHGATDPTAHIRLYPERPGLAEYLSKGYIANTDDDGGAASVTLEDTNADFAIAQFAKAMGDMKTDRQFLTRSAYWRNIFDPETKYIRARGEDGFSVQHWVSAQQNGVSGTVMPLDASLVTLGDINRGAWPTQFGRRRGTIFSYVMNNYWNTNFRAGHGGHFRFRYVITSAPTTNATESSRMGWEEMTPLEKDLVATQDKAMTGRSPLNGKQDSFLEIGDPDLLLETWKPAEDGKGTILRFLDLGGATRTVRVHTPLVRLEQAWRTDAVERNRQPLSLLGPQRFQFTIHPHEIVTVRVVGEDAAKTSLVSTN
jgi:hypothetical protein